MEVSGGVFWAKESVDYEIWRTYPDRKLAYSDAFIAALANKLETRPDILTEQQKSDYAEAVMSEDEAARLVNLSRFHRHWPTILEESEMEPEFSFEYRSRGSFGKRIITVSNYYNKAETPKLLIASQRFDRPHGARTISQISTALRVAPTFIDDVVAEESISLSSFRDPETLEFDEYLTPDSLQQLFICIQKRKAHYFKHRRQ
jgi:hypothetical protein